MNQATAQWQERPSNPEAAGTLEASLGLHAVLARILSTRGITSQEQAKRFLEPRLSDLPDPDGFAGMAEAVERLVHALQHDECVGIFGDYDVDGVTSTTLLWDFLHAAGGRAVATIPNRLTEGYGLSLPGLERLISGGAQVIVTVDCGVTNHAEIAHAKARGVDVIVIDHHRVPATLPDAVAVINPHRPDCTQNAKHLCAVGITFYLCAALRRALRKKGFFQGRAEPDLRESLDLVALGTVADVVPLVEDNRIFVAQGLARIRHRKRAGMQALLEVAGVDPLRASAGTIGFHLGPRINAAGRLKDAMTAVKMLRTPHLPTARRLATILDEENQSRRNLEAAMVEEAVADIEASPDLLAAPLLVVGRTHWHPGVVGIVASRLVDRFGKPAIVIGDGGRGAGRSIPAFHLHDALSDPGVSVTLKGFGGHAHAAGLQLDWENLASFRDAICQHAESVLRPEDAQKRLHHDGALSLSELDEDLINALAKAAPFGRGNPEPTFVFPALKVSGVRELKGKHLKGTVSPSRGIHLIAFGHADKAAWLADPIDVLAIAELNHWRGSTSLQLRARDLRVPEGVA
jgi:single-stranded-DNA-specific exonuclease